jgi:hypothetical protein
VLLEMLARGRSSDQREDAFLVLRRVVETGVHHLVYRRYPTHKRAR